MKEIIKLLGWKSGYNLILCWQDRVYTVKFARYVKSHAQYDHTQNAATENHDNDQKGVNFKKKKKSSLFELRVIVKAENFQMGVNELWKKGNETELVN